MTDLVLQHGLSFADLYSREGLVRLDAAFMAHLKAADASLFAMLATGRAAYLANAARRTKQRNLIGIEGHVT